VMTIIVLRKTILKTFIISLETGTESVELLIIDASSCIRKVMAVMKILFEKLDPWRPVPGELLIFQ